jgi:hypothetical protein
MEEGGNLARTAVLISEIKKKKAILILILFRGNQQVPGLATATGVVGG